MNKAAPAKEFRLDLHGAFLRRTDLSRASLKRANLAGADFSKAIFRGADFEDAILDGTILKGADLTGAKNLTRSQLSKAILDETTKLPEEFSTLQTEASREDE
jgi:uncharacterized protein YjbI with pentapeptide repeats